MNAQERSAGKRQARVSGKSPGTDEVDSDVSPEIARMATSQAAHRAAHRYSMIAAAAFRRAEDRGFAPGHELEDWLNAALEVEAAERLSVLCPCDAITPEERTDWRV